METFFTHENTFRAKVFDVESKQEIPFVCSADVASNELVVNRTPLTVCDGEVMNYKVRYRSIRAIYGGMPYPQMFMCFDRL